MTIHIEKNRFLLKYSGSSVGLDRISPALSFQGIINVQNLFAI
jgi:hypothetical protein